MNLKRVVVTGLGTLTPIGNDVPQFWNALTKGVSGAGLITHFDASSLKCHIAAEVKGYDYTQHFDRKEVRTLDLFTQYGLVVVDEAIKDAGLDLDKTDRNRIGVVFGTGMGGCKSFQDELFSFVEGNYVPRFSPFFITKTIGDICAGQISIKYGFRGPNYCTTAACASSAMSIADSFMMLQLGKADIMVTGGSEAAIIPVGIGGFASMRALSLRNDDPATASRFITKDSSVTVLGPTSVINHARIPGGRNNFVQFNAGTRWTENGIVFTAVPAEHSDLFAVGAIIDDGERKYYVTGDTLYNERIFPHIPEGIFALFLPVNGAGNNMNMRDAADFARRVGAKHVVPVHVGMFDSIDPALFECENRVIPEIYREIVF